MTLAETGAYGRTIQGEEAFTGRDKRCVPG